MQNKTSSKPQAPTQLRLAVPEAGRQSLDEAYHTEATQAVLKALSTYIDKALTAHEAEAIAHNKYEMASWPYLQADSVGFRRALKNLKIVVLKRD